MINVIGVRFKPVGKIYFFDPNGEHFAVGDYAVVETARGTECGYVAQKNHDVEPERVIHPLKKVIRKATADDVRRLEANGRREAEAYKVCMQRIEDRALDMKLVDVECAFDGSGLLFYFTADGRVDFRELVKDLASVFHTRIELRQIGVRDEAKMVGGLGICGRTLCCSGYLDAFVPVSIKMAKEQNLSLNPTKISGVCGRLMCCLKYEQDAYEALTKVLPKVGSLVLLPDGLEGTVEKVSLLRQMVTVKYEEGDNSTVVKDFPAADLTILRRGKAPNNAQPLPLSKEDSPLLEEDE